MCYSGIWEGSYVPENIVINEQPESAITLEEDEICRDWILAFPSRDDRPSMEDMLIDLAALEMGYD